MLKKIFGTKKAQFATLALGLMAVMVASAAFAYTDPQSGDLFYEAYDIVINKIMAGPVGFIMGALMVIGGIITMVLGKGFLLPLIAVIGGAIIVKIDDIVSSFGFTPDLMLTVQEAIPQITQFLF